MVIKIWFKVMQREVPNQPQSIFFLEKSGLNHLKGLKIAELPNEKVK